LYRKCSNNLYYTKINISMKSFYKIAAVIFIAVLTICISIPGCKSKHTDNKEYTEKHEEGEGHEMEGEEENDKYDGPLQAVEFDNKITMDPALGRVPKERLITALEQTRFSRITDGAFISSYGTWIERGPNADAIGPSNGNTRANSGMTSGRMRAILVDKADATGKTIFAAGIDGGLWKTTDITASPATWTPVSDFLSNLAVSFICQDPTNTNTMYFCTGESYFNGDAVQGVGVFKSTDHGVNWTLLPSTSTFTQGTRILCDAAGNVYLGSLTGILRSTNGGTSWTTITPTGSSARIGDIEISSTGRMHITTGLGNSAIGVYRYTDIPATVAAATWTTAATPFPYPSGANCRVELACSGNTLYALPSNTSAQVATIYKSTDGGATWAASAGQPTAGWASQQAWYALSACINPADANQCIVGGLDNWKTTDGGASWTKISLWVGLAGQYAHADQHMSLWYDNGNKLLFGNDGGIFYSADGGTTIRDRNAGLRIKQFYSVAMHPSSTNYFLAGAQDNGTHQLNGTGLTSSVEVTGGDGAYTAIDQDQPQYQFGAYVYQTYRRSVNSGANWSSINFYLGTNLAASDFGNFINVFRYDNTNNIMYAAGQAGNFFRWTNPQTQASGNYYAGGTPAWPATASQVALTALNGASVLAVTVSPTINDRIYFGTAGGRVCYADGASTIASGSAGVSISTGLPAASVSCIAFGTTENNMMVSYSNYGVNNIWVSSNGGLSWTAIDGNLPDMPVRWVMFAPGDNTKAIIATETGVWLTQSISGAATTWISSPTFPAVRTDMLQYRAADQMVVAATHGRGLWTQTSYDILPLNNFTLKGRWSGNTADLNWSYEDLPAGSRFEVETSPDAIHYTMVGTVAKGSSRDYSFKYNPSGNLYYRIKGIENTGAVKFSNVVRLFRSGSGSNGALQIVKLYPNPVKDNLTIAFNAPAKGSANYTIASATGQIVWSKKEELAFTGNYNITENIAALKPGSYVFTVTMNGAKASQAFIKQ
jgi:hypothetical protein